MNVAPLTMLAVVLGAAPALAQQPASTPLPDQCRKMMQQGQAPMQGMQGTTGMAADMPRANAGYMEAMRKMNPPMMAAMTIQDPDVAFLCTMISHHQGGIDMARAVIANGKHADVKKKAEQTLKEQEQDIRKLTELLDKHAR